MSWQCGCSERFSRKRPKMFLWRRSQELGFSVALLEWILKDLQLYPYKIQIKYKLTPAYMEFLVSTINHYLIYGLHLLRDTLYNGISFFTHTRHSIKIDLPYEIPCIMVYHSSHTPGILLGSIFISVYLRFGFFVLWHITPHGLFNAKAILVEE